MRLLADLPIGPSLALFAATLAALSDLRRRVVPDWITYSAILIGLSLAFLQHGVGGLKASAIGGLVTFLPAFIMLALNQFGGGDAKLLAGIGCLLGAQHGLGVFMLASVIGSVFALGMLARRGVLISSLTRVAHTLAAVVVPGLGRPAGDPPAMKLQMRFAPMIALATAAIVTGAAGRAFEVIR
jgi:prepilin peptidase CpaA